MRNIKEILRLSSEGRLSIRQIAKSCGCSHSTVLLIIERVKTAGIIWPLPENVTETDLEAKLYGAPVTSGSRPLPDMNYLHRELKRRGVTLQLLWHEYKQQYPDGLMYSQFCEKFRQWSKQLDISMRQIHRAGEKMFVDWAGTTMPIVDQETGEIKQAYLFLAVLGASSYTYVEACASQDLMNWVSAHSRAFAYFQGVPAIIVPDNLRTGVTKPCYYEPDINPAYQEMASHYGTAVIPARIRKPRDKAKVESGVGIADRWIVAALRNQTFFSLWELNEAIRGKLVEFNNRRFQKLEGSRRSQFETIERPALKPLPSSAYEFAIWKKARVNIDYHVEFEKNFYSVPYSLVRQEVDLRVTAQVVEVLFKGQRVASHPRSHGRNIYSTDNLHRPASHRAYLEWTPSRLIHWAGTIGPHTAELVKHILETKPHPEQGYRSCLGIMRLGKAYPSERLESAAARALKYRTANYHSLKSILEKGLDQVGASGAVSIPVIQHSNIRGAGYYSDQGGVPQC